MKAKLRREAAFVAALALAALIVVAVPAFALDPAPSVELAPTTSGVVESDRVAEPGTEQVGDIAPPPAVELFPAITTVPIGTQPPKIDSAQFGVGWPAAVAAGVALLAVLMMALVWRRDGVR